MDLHSTAPQTPVCYNSRVGNLLRPAESVPCCPSQRRWSMRDDVLRGAVLTFGGYRPAVPLPARVTDSSSPQSGLALRLGARSASRYADTIRASGPHMARQASVSSAVWLSDNKVPPASTPVKDK